MNFAFIQGKIDYGKGIAATKLGPPYDCYRVTPTSNGDFPDGWTKIQSNYPIFAKKFTGENKIMTGMRTSTQWLDLIANMNPFLLGDVFLLVDPPFVPGASYGPGATSIAGPTEEFNAIALAWHPPVVKAIGARLDRLVTVFRSAVAPVAQLDSSEYWQSTHENDSPLILTNGVFSFGQPGQQGASFIPAGIGSAHRQTGSQFGPGVPGMQKEMHWFFYLPPLPGYLPREGDAIIDMDGARYLVENPYEQLSGAVGNQMIVDRQIAQAS